MSVKEHYDNHLGNFYSWMVGDFNLRQQEFEKFLESHHIHPTASGKAIDLGAGHGIQSVSLAKKGFNVLAVDFNDQLLEELRKNAEGTAITIRKGDIRNLKQFADGAYELIVCCGDTLTHLESKAEVKALLSDMAASLHDGGRVILSFRDYSTELQGDNRFILVKSEAHRILSCMLEYTPEYVHVTDILYEKQTQDWTQKVSSYNKVRMTTGEVMDHLVYCNMAIEVNQVINRMVTIVAIKSSPEETIF